MCGIFVLIVGSIGESLSSSCSPSDGGSSSMLRARIMGYKHTLELASKNVCNLPL
jgi:hypothetical protein